MSLKPWQLNLIKQHGAKPVWTVVAPLNPGGTVNQGPVSRSNAMTYAAAAQHAVKVQHETTWLRTRNNVVELHCDGQFCCFGA